MNYYDVSARCFSLQFAIASNQNKFVATGGVGDLMMKRGHGSLALARLYSHEQLHDIINWGALDHVSHALLFTM